MPPFDIRNYTAEADAGKKTGCRAAAPHDRADRTLVLPTANLSRKGLQWLIRDRAGQAAGPAASAMPPVSDARPTQCNKSRWARGRHAVVGVGAEA